MPGTIDQGRLKEEVKSMSETYDERLAEIAPPHFPEDASARQLIRDYFSIDLPISGGWGYSEPDACIIGERCESTEFEGVETEYSFVRKMIWLELNILPPLAGLFSSFEVEFTGQSIYEANSKYYDTLEVTVVAAKVHNNNDGCGSQNMGLGSIKSTNNVENVSYARVFWFDISHFYGNF